MIPKAMKKLMRRFGPRPIDPRFLQAATAMPVTLSDLRTRPRDENVSVIRSLCSYAYLGNETAMCRVLGRYKMLVDTEDMGVSVHLIGDGFWELWHTEVMLRLLKPGMKAIDIGANLGYFSLLMSDVVGESGSVHAFEPNPAIAGRLRKSLAINGFADRATVHELALCDRSGDGLFAIPVNEPGGGHIIADPTGRTGTSIAMERFDAIAALADADYIKIDVEGFEDTVWRGMRTLLASGRPLTIVLEFTGARYDDAAGFADEILADGFSMKLLDSVKGVVPIDRAGLLANPLEEQLILLQR